jgi:hypothetical protein
MIQLKCTKKVIDYFNIQDIELFESKEIHELLGNWYLNIFKLERKTIFIFVNERTLFSFIIFGINKNNYNTLIDKFRYDLEYLLKYEKIDNKKIEFVSNQCKDIQITKTNNRSILGTLNNLIEIYKCMIYDEGGLIYCNLMNIISKINRIPQKKLSWLFSIEKTKEILDKI